MYFHWPTAGEHMDLLLTLGGNGSSLIWTKRTVSTNGFFSRSYLLIDLNEKSFVTVMDEACVHPFTIFTQTTASFINDKLHLREIRLSNKKKNWRAYFKSKNGNRERSEMKNCHFLCAEYAVFCKTNIEVFLLTSYFFLFVIQPQGMADPTTKKYRVCVGFIRSQYLKKEKKKNKQIMETREYKSITLFAFFTRRCAPRCAARQIPYILPTFCD